MEELEKEVSEVSYDELNQVAMQIILKAGDARNEIQQAVAAAKKGDFKQADELALQAKESIRQSHVIHTQMISKEARGDVKIIPTLLFNHAQDTLMTINSECNLSMDIIDLCRIIYEKEKKDE